MCACKKELTDYSSSEFHAFFARKDSRFNSLIVLIRRIKVVPRCERNVTAPIQTVEFYLQTERPLEAELSFKRVSLGYSL